MNRLQRNICMGGIACAVVALVFPPVEMVASFMGSPIQSWITYAFLPLSNLDSIVVVRLVLELAIIALVTIGATLAANGKKPHDTST